MQGRSTGAVAALPAFENVPSVATFSGAPAPVQIESAGYGRMFQTRLRNGAKSGPNFAGAFTVVVWGVVVVVRLWPLSTRGLAFCPSKRCGSRTGSTIGVTVA